MRLFLWIFGSTLLMSVFAWVGLLLLWFRDSILHKLLSSLVAFAAGSLLGGAFLHMIPEGISHGEPGQAFFLWILAGFSLFLCMEQFLNWHHAHNTVNNEKSPESYLILFADGLHNFIGGVAIGGSFIVSVQVGIITWLSAAAHEIPQEFGNFGILIHGGWNKTKALVFNFISALTVVPGGLMAWYLSNQISIAYLLAFASGNFIYIAASDLIPQIKDSKRIGRNITSTIMFGTGILLIILPKVIFN